MRDQAHLPVVGLVELSLKPNAGWFHPYWALLGFRISLSNNSLATLPSRKLANHDQLRTTLSRRA